MEESPVTRASLLIRLRDPSDRSAWQQFVKVYASVVYGFARRRGLQDADAADLMQEVFRTVAASAKRLEYDPKRGTFRGWLYTVTRNKLYDFLDRQRRQVRGSGDSADNHRLHEQPEATDEWNHEYERRTFAWAVSQVRDEFQESTWQAFWLTAVEGRDAKDVGRQLGLSPGAVYVAKSRILARLKEQVKLLPDE